MVVNHVGAAHPRKYLHGEDLAGWEKRWQEEPAPRGPEESLASARRAALEEVDLLIAQARTGRRLGDFDPAMLVHAEQGLGEATVGYRLRDWREVYERQDPKDRAGEPSLAELTRAAIANLSKHQEGFVLMVESGRIDKYSHSLDWERAVYDTIMLDNAVRETKAWAAARGGPAPAVEAITTADYPTPARRPASAGAANAAATARSISPLPPFLPPSRLDTSELA